MTVKTYTRDTRHYFVVADITKELPAYKLGALTIYTEGRGDTLLRGTATEYQEEELLAQRPRGTVLKERASRPTWDEYFLNVAKAISTRASCPRASVGAVIVSKEHFILSMGYNGAASNELDCLRVGCSIEGGHCQRAIHAEVNAVTHANRQDLVGSRVYIYSSRGDLEPCRECKKVLMSAGIKW